MTVRPKKPGTFHINKTEFNELGRIKGPVVVEFVDEAQERTWHVPLTRMPRGFTKRDWDFTSYSRSKIREAAS